MLVTAYSDKGPGKDWTYFKNHPEGVGPGTIAVANTNPIPFPFGTDMAVFSADGTRVEYYGTVRDTGAGWDARHHNAESDSWIDIWLPTTKEALEFGKQTRNVTICTAPVKS